MTAFEKVRDHFGDITYWGDMEYFDIKTPQQKFLLELIDDRKWRATELVDWNGCEEEDFVQHIEIYTGLLEDCIEQIKDVLR